MTELSYKGNKYPVKFYHTRFLEKDKTVTTNGGITFASIEISENKYMSAMAVCSLKDHFNKKIGRMMSMGRLKKGLESGKDLEKLPEKTIKDIVYDMIYRC